MEIEHDNNSSCVEIDGQQRHHREANQSNEQDEDQDESNP